MILLAVVVVGIILCVLLITRSGWHSVGRSRYYRNEQGKRVTGWYDVDGRRYYFDPTAGGSVYIGWLDLDGTRYYLDLDGSLRTGWMKKTEGSYYFDPDGKMQTGWLETGSGRYYMGQDGRMCTGWVEIEGRLHYLDENGHPKTGWTTVDGSRYFFERDGAVYTGWLNLDGKRCYLDPDGKLHTGWLELDGKTYYLDQNGCISTGWVDVDGQTYYMDTDGQFCTGWQTIEEKNYYFKMDHTLAKGAVMIDGKTYFFSSTGEEILLVNRWNPVPEDYRVDLTYSGGGLVSTECAEALYQMMTDCKAAGCYPYVCSSYRSVSVQQGLFARQIGIQWMYSSSYDEAYERAAQIVAIPGTSEHHTGLAVDIVDGSYGLLDEKQAETASQQWLMANCWRYGFVLRYPEGTTQWTGIVYEPWHYRYVGMDLAQELYDLDMCLEEYLAMFSE